MNEPKPPSPKYAIPPRTTPVIISAPEPQHNVKTVFAMNHYGVMPSKTECVGLSTEQFDYYKGLTRDEQRKLPKRDDPTLPDAIDRHMRAFATPKYTKEDREMQKENTKRWNAKFLNYMKEKK